MDFGKDIDVLHALLERDSDALLRLNSLGQVTFLQY